jgi:hypothetical protein
MKKLVVTVLLFMSMKGYSQDTDIRYHKYFNTYDMSERFSNKSNKWVSTKVDSIQDYWNVFFHDGGPGPYVIIQSPVTNESLYFFVSNFEEIEKHYKITSLYNSGVKIVLDFYIDKEFEIVEINCSKHFNKELKEYVPSKKYRYKKIRLPDSPDVYSINLKD